MEKQKIILGSGSPRRRELLGGFFSLKIHSPDIDESEKSEEEALGYVHRISRSKWTEIFHQHKGDVILTADTTVCLKKEILGKAESEKQAFEMIKKLSGQRHEVITSVCVGYSESTVRQIEVQTEIVFRELKDREISRYVSSDEWRGKAGAYGIQGSAQQFVHSINGSLTNVIGLPLSESIELLETALQSKNKT